MDDCFLQYELWPAVLAFSTPATRAMIYCTCQQLSLQRKDGSFSVINAVAQEGQKELFVELCKYGYAYDVKTFAAAASGGSLGIVRYLHENGCPWDVEVFIDAARAGHLHIVQYLDVNGCTWDSRALSQAIASGNLELLDYLYNKGPWKIDPFKCTIAVDCEHLEVLKYLHQKGNPLQWHTAACAAEKGNLPILEYLHTNNCRKGCVRCPWNENIIMDAAILQGNVEIVKYLFANGCPWTTNSYNIALREKHISLLEYLDMTDCPK